MKLHACKLTDAEIKELSKWKDENNDEILYECEAKDCRCRVIQHEYHVPITENVCVGYEQYSREPIYHKKTIGWSRRVTIKCELDTPAIVLKEGVIDFSNFDYDNQDNREVVKFTLAQHNSQFVPGLHDTLWKRLQRIFGGVHANIIVRLMAG